MADASYLTIDKERIKLITKYWASNIQEDEHYTYEIKEKVYINASNLQAKHGHGYTGVDNIISKALIKSYMKSYKWAGDIDGTEFHKIDSQIASNLYHD